MKSKLKKILSSLLVAVIILTATPLNGFAMLKLKLDWLDLSLKASAEDVGLAPTGQCGENVYWTFDSSTGLLTISGTGEMTEEEGAFYNEALIKKVVINNGVTSIGVGAFCLCKNLTDVSLPSSITSIGCDAFYSCTSLTSIKIPNSVRSIGWDAFASCSSLESVELGCGLTSIDISLFEYCSSLKTIIIASSVTNIRFCAFLECSDLTDVYYSGSEEQWNSISIEEDNECLSNAEIHFNINLNSCYNDSTGTYEHNFTAVKSVEPTCEEDGYTLYRCSDCDFEYLDYTDALDHELLELDSIEPTCTHEGYNRYRCERCGNEFDYYVAPLGHSMENGVCTRCGAKHTVSDISLNEFKIVVTDIPGDETLFKFVPEESGTYYFFSDSQKDIYGYIYDSEMNEIISDDDGGENNNFLISYEFEAGETYYLKGRYYSDSTGSFYVGLTDEFTSSHTLVVDVNEPTCTEGGYTVCHCSHCEYVDSEYDYTEPLGHSFEDGYCIRCHALENCMHEHTTIINQIEPTCDEEGYTGDIYCPDCFEIIEYGEWVSSHYNTKELINTVSPTCTDYGYSLFRCTECGELFEVDYVEPLGHNKDSVVEVVNPTCTQYGYTVYHCDRCGCDFEDEYVENLEHRFENDVCKYCGYVIQTINLNEIKPVNIIDNSGVLLKFVPNESGTYYFFSDSQDDAFGYIYDSEMNELMYDDDGGENCNFLISYDFVAGETYYLKGRFCDSLETGNFYVGLTDKYTSCHDFEFFTEEATCITGGWSGYRCRRCGYYDEVYQDATGHSFVDGICEKCGWVEGLEYEINDEYSLTIVGYNGDAEELVIPSKLYNYDVTRIGNYAFYGCTSLEGITIPDSVTNIGDYAFISCYCLSDIFYSGSEYSWNNICFGENVSDDLYGSHIHYNVSADEVSTHLKKEIICEAGCNNNGTVSVSCDCGYSYEMNTPALGHNFEDGECTRCGTKLVVSDISLHECKEAEINKYNNEEAIFRFIPTESGTYYFYSDSYSSSAFCELYDSKMEMLDYSGDIGNFWIEYDFIKDQTYYFKCSLISSENIGKYFVCLEDHFESYHDGYYIKTVEPTCTEPGYDVCYCNRCECDYNTNFIDSLGHTWDNDVCERCGLEIVTIKEDEPVMFVSNPMLLKFIPEEDELLYFYSMGYRSLYGTIYDENMEFLYGDCYNGYLDNFKILFEFEKGKTYYFEISDMFDGDTPPVPIIVSKKYEDFSANYNSGAVIDYENKLIYGLSPGLNSWSVFNYISVSRDKNFNINIENYYIGTGSVFTFYDEDWNVTEEYTVILFGDVNGDGWYDGMDAVLTSCIASGTLTQNDLTPAQWKAADCNHDGEINQQDVEILEEAGILLASVDQTKSEEKLLETSSVYAEYLNLVDQSVKTESTTEVKEETTDEPVNPVVNPFATIISMIKDLVEIIRAAIAFIKADLPGLPFSIKE